jgi:hypothetical protein
MTQLANEQTNKKVPTQSGPSGLLQRRCNCGQHIQSGGECNECKKKRKDLQRSARNEAPGWAGGQTAPSIVNDVLRSPGQPLESRTRARMEQSFGRDFSQVRVHNGAQAARSARAVQAQAYTVGQSIVFDTGRYEPETTSGQRLLAHELTHTIQQGRGSAGKVQMFGDLTVNHPGDRYEREAENSAARVISGQRVSTTSSLAAGSLQRQADISQAPADMLAGPCTLTAGPGHMPGTDVMLSVSVSAITPAQRAAITTFVTSWVAAGSRDDVIVDGWASTDGAQSTNWRISCDRAEAVKAELVTQGIPAAKIFTFAHGESTEFSTTSPDQNRRAIITTRPTPGPPPVGPVPVPGAGAAITSETVLLAPAPRNRTKIGVGEDVDLTHSSGSVTWATTAGTLSATTGATVRLTAPDTAQNVVITGGGARIALEIVAPTSVFMEQAAGSNVKHNVGQPDSGFLANVFLLPDTVNFRNVRYRELDVAGVALPGVYSCNPAAGGHCGAGGGGVACPDKALTDTVDAGKGTRSVLGDCAYSGHCGTAPPFAAGALILAIPYEYKVGAGAFHRFAVVVQTHTLAADGSTLSTSKAGASVSTTVASPTSLIPTCP